MNKYLERIETLRGIMMARGYDAVIITGSDPHQSEYPALRWKQVEWLTGFTGEAGDVVITATHAGLWTDSRYFIQAVQQLEGTSVLLHKTRVPEEIPIAEYLASTLPEQAVVAVDSLCYSVEDYNTLKARFNVALVPDLMSAIWEDRPQIPQTPISCVQCGESVESKISWLRDEIRAAGADGAFISALDQIAWLLNVRGSDIDYNPLVISYLLVRQDTVDWFVLKDEDQTSDPFSEQSFGVLEEYGVRILPYNMASVALSELSSPVLASFQSTSIQMLQSAAGMLTDWQCPVDLRKAVKNEYEVSCMRAVHIDDGVALENFLYWLETSLNNGRTITEWDAAVQLGKYRAQIEDYVTDSFETISAYAHNAALPHYIAPHQNAPVLEQKGLYLVDSGGQYLRGTTDITRTIPLGECTPEQKRYYTLVLKGHIALAMAVFPAGTPGCRLDVLSREPLWENGLNFGHGTGHGVGFYLGVHEGPQSIRQNMNDVPMLEGMITSDEPGLYIEGSCGIRHENLLLCKSTGTTPFGSFLCFESLTLCHFDTSIVDWSLLTPQQAQWLRDYNRSVYHELSALLEPEVAQWLAHKCLED